jgi:branched-chain amino acid transport system permease protein
MRRRRAPATILWAGAALACLPVLHLPAFYDSFLYLVLHWVILATSWNLLSGYAGYFSFGHGAFFGAGVYTTATLAGRFGWSFLWTLPVAALVSALLGVGLGAVVFRVRGVRGELFALLTLAVTFVLSTIVLNTPIDGGPGVYLNAVAVPPLGPTASSSFYLMALTLAVATLLIAWRIHASRFGAGLFAIRDDEDAAEVVGVPTYTWKLLALGISCALAGAAGGIHALFVSYVTAGEVFSITVPLTVVLMSVLGSTRHWAGPAVGATAITALLYAFTAGDHALLGKAVSGAILVAAILFMPDGILEWLRRRWRPAAVVAVDSGYGEVSRALVWPFGTPTIDDEPAPASTTAAASPVGRGDVLLRVQGLSKSFKGLRALSGVNLQVRRGEILGLLGPNGSGKSTFINVISGHHAPSAGEIWLGARQLSGLSAHRIAQAGIARTYQIPRPFAHLTVLDNVAIAAMFGGRGIHDIDSGRREAMQWLDFTHLAVKAAATPNDLNLHQRKFLELARALASRPQLVLLDEVLCGLTPAEMHEAVAMIRSIRDQGATIVFVEHVMDAVMALTDRIIVFDQGQLLAEGSASEVMSKPEVVTAYLGTAHA